MNQLNQNSNTAIGNRLKAEVRISHCIVIRFCVLNFTEIQFKGWPFRRCFELPPWVLPWWRGIEYYNRDSESLRESSLIWVNSSILELRMKLRNKELFQLHEQQLIEKRRKLPDKQRIIELESEHACLHSCHHMFPHWNNSICSTAFIRPRDFTLDQGAQSLF